MILKYIYISQITSKRQYFNIGITWHQNITEDPKWVSSNGCLKTTELVKTEAAILFYFIFSFIFISCRLITLQYCSGFFHTLTWISHGFTCIPHPNPPPHLPLHQIRMLVLVAQPYLTLCDHPMDYSPPGSSVYGVLQARILKWVAIPFCKGSFQFRDQTWVSCIAKRFFVISVTREAHFIMLKYSEIL